MAELQTITAAFAVVKVATSVISLVKKLAEANSEAQIWLHKVEQMSHVNKNVAILLKTRQERRLHTSPPELESHLEERIDASVRACQVCLEDMERTLRRLQNVPMSSVRNLINADFIRKQERIVDKHVSSISLSLTLIHSVDQAATHRLVESLVNLLDVNAEARSGLPLPSAVLDHEAGESSIGTEASAYESATSTAVEDVELPATLQDQAKLLQVAEKALMVAVKENQYSEVQNLLTTSEDSQSMYYIDIEGWTVLHYAALIQSPQILGLLLQAGLTSRPGFVDKKTRQGETALMIAAKHYGTDTAVQMATMLLDADCEINIADNADQTALYFAIEGPPHEEEEKLANLLLDRGADVMFVHEKIPGQVNKYRRLEEEVRRHEEETRRADQQGNDNGSTGGRLSRVMSLVVS